MSALGHKRTCAAQNGMSALAPIGPRKRIPAKGHVRFTPESGHVRRTRPCLLWANSGHGPDLFDHLICTEQKLFRDRQIQRFGGGQIDTEVKLCWLLHRQVGWLSATQDFVDVFGGASE